MISAVLSRASGLFDAWAANLWQACWQGGLLVLAIWAIVHLVPSMPARWQCWLWRLATLKFFIVLLLPPLVDVPLLPPPAEVRVEVRSPMPRTLPVRQAGRDSVSTVKTAPWPDLPTIVRCAWLIGIGYSLLWLFQAWKSARRLKRAGRTIAEGPCVEELRRQARLFGLRIAPKLIEVPGGGSPMLFGTLRPTIALPAETSRRLNAGELAMVLGHELAHIRRRDLFWGLGALLARSIFFFHPLIWLCQRQLVLAQEMAADELAISRQGHDPLGYGSLLVAVVGEFGPTMSVRPFVSAVSLETVGPVHSLTRRLVAMSRIGRTSRRALVGSGVLLGAVVLLGVVPWRLVAAKVAEYEAIPNPQCDFGQKPYRMDSESYGLVVSTDAKGETRIAGVNKRTGQWKWLDLPKNNQVVFEPIMGNDVAAFIQHGEPISQLIVYNGRLNKWSTFPLEGRAIDVIPYLGDRMVCYQLSDRVVAYSATQDAWGMLLTEASPAVGDYSVFVDTAKGRYVFPDKSGGWAAVASSATTQ